MIYLNLNWYIPWGTWTSIKFEFFKCTLVISVVPARVTDRFQLISTAFSYIHRLIFRGNFSCIPRWIIQAHDLVWKKRERIARPHQSLQFTEMYIIITIVWHATRTLLDNSFGGSSRYFGALLEEEWGFWILLDSWFFFLTFTEYVLNESQRLPQFLCLPILRKRRGGRRAYPCNLLGWFLFLSHFSSYS